jgi:hypothetical protein
MKQKGQAEIIGLMIIVVIITIGMLFYLSYVTSQSDSSSKDSLQKEFVDNELSASFIQTIVRTTIPQCQGLSVEDLIVFCGLDEQPSRCNQNPCQLLNQTLDHIRNNSLESWGRSYSLKVDFGESSYLAQTPMIFQTDDCEEGTVGRRAPGYQPIPYPTWDKAFLSLAICAK